MNKNFLWLIIFGVILIFGWVVLGGKRQAVGALDSFAQCLRERGAIMYGADWCPHCQNEKEAFSSSFKYVNYVECPASPQKCISANINGYPTWVFSDGRRFEGEQGIEKLSEVSGCSLPSR